jgi:protein subunit release factor B
VSVSVEGYVITYVSDSYGKGGQHTNGPDYGVYRCEHEATKTAVEVHSYQARNAHRARELALTLCAIAVEELCPATHGRSE